MTDNPQVPVAKHLLEQAEKNAHLKETFTKSQNLKYVYFLYKQHKTKNHFSKRFFYHCGKLKKHNEIGGRQLKAVGVLNLATLQTWSNPAFRIISHLLIVLALGFYYRLLLPVSGLDTNLSINST